MNRNITTIFRLNSFMNSFHNIQVITSFVNIKKFVSKCLQPLLLLLCKKPEFTFLLFSPVSNENIKIIHTATFRRLNLHFNTNKFKYKRIYSRNKAPKQNITNIKRSCETIVPVFSKQRCHLVNLR